MASPFDFIAQSIAAHNGSATQTSSAPTSPSSPRTSPLEDYYNEQMQQKQATEEARDIIDGRGRGLVGGLRDAWLDKHGEAESKTVDSRGHNSALRNEYQRQHPNVPTMSTALTDDEKSQLQRAYADAANKYKDASKKAQSVSDKKAQSIRPEAGVNYATTLEKYRSELQSASDEKAAAESEMDKLRKQLEFYNVELPDVDQNVFERLWGSIKGGSKQAAGSLGGLFGYTGRVATGGQSAVDKALRASGNEELSALYHVGTEEEDEKAMQMQQAIADKSAELSESGGRDIERSKLGASKAGKFALDAVSQVPALAADMAANAVLPGSGMAMMMGRSFGGGVQQAEAGGGNLAQAGAYGAASAAKEYLTEKMFGGLDLAYGKGFADTAVEKLVGKLAKTDIGRTVLRTIINGGGGEFVEEFVSSAVDPTLRAIYNGKSIGENYSEEQVSDWLYDGLVGAALGIAGSGASIATGADAKKNAELRSGEVDKAFELMTGKKAVPEPQSVAETQGDITTPPTPSNDAVARPEELNSAVNNDVEAQSSETQKNTAPAGTERRSMSMEDYADSNSPVWNNLAYDDTASQQKAMKEAHDRMVTEGKVVEVPESTIQKTAESFPDLRGMKKAERTPILKQKMSEVKASLRQFLSGLKGSNFEFEVNGNVLEAKLYDTGIKEVLEKITQDKANMLSQSDQIFKNAEYLYSLPDYEGNSEIYRWNYFYTPVKIGDSTVGVRIAVRDMVNPAESQIYNWGIKKAPTLDGGSPEQSSLSPDVSSVGGIDASLDGARPLPDTGSNPGGVSSDASEVSTSDNSIPTAEQNVNREQAENSAKDQAYYVDLARKLKERGWSREDIKDATGFVVDDRGNVYDEDTGEVHYDAQEEADKAAWNRAAEDFGEKNRDTIHEATSKAADSKTFLEGEDFLKGFSDSRYTEISDAVTEFKSKLAGVGDGHTPFSEFADYYKAMKNSDILGDLYSERVNEQVQLAKELSDTAQKNPIPYNVDKYRSAVTKAMQMASHYVEKASKVRTELNELTAAVKENGSKKKPYETQRNPSLRYEAKSAGEKLGAKFIRYQIMPRQMFQMIDGFKFWEKGAGYRMADTIEKSAAKNQTVLVDADNFFSDVVKEKAYRDFSTGKTMSGVKVGGEELSMDMAVSLYKAIKTMGGPDAYRAQHVSGFALYNGNDDPIRIKTNDVSPLYYAAESAIESDPIAKAYVEAFDDMADYLGKETKKVSKEVDGTDIYTYVKGDYFPLTYSAAEGNFNWDKQKAQEFGLPDFKSLKDRTRTDGGYVNIAPVTMVTDGYIRRAADYIAFGELADTFSIMDYMHTFGTSTLVDSVKQNMGSEYGAWMENYVKDVQDINQTRAKSKDNFWGALNRNFQTAVLVGNPGTPFKQKGSMWLAMSELDPRAVVKAAVTSLNPGNKQMKAARNNPLLQFRAKGNIDASISDALQDQSTLFGKMAAKSKVLKSIQNWIPAADIKEVSKVYLASCYDVQMKNPGIDINSAKFKEMVDETFQRASMRTQSQYTMNMRDEISRGDNDLLKSLTMFQTQQRTNFNNLMTALGEAKAANGTEYASKANKARARALGGFVASNIAYGAMSAVADALRHKLKQYWDDDEEQQIDPTKIAIKVGESFLEGVGGTVIFGDTATNFITSLFSDEPFYENGVGAVGAINDAMSAAIKLVDNPSADNVRKTAGGIANLLGIPLNNAYTLLNSFGMYTADIINAMNRSKESGNILNELLKGTSAADIAGKKKAGLYSISDDPADDALKIFDSIKKAVDKLPPDQFTYTDENGDEVSYELTKADKEQYRKDAEASYNSGMDALLKAFGYDKLSDKAKEDVEKQIKGYAKDAAEQGYLDNKGLGYDTGAPAWTEAVPKEDVPSYLVSKKILDADGKKTDYDAIDYLIGGFSKIPSSVQTQLKDDGVNVNALLYAKLFGIGSEAWYSNKGATKDAEESLGSSDVAKAIAVYNNMEGKSDEQILNAIKTQVLPAAGGKQSATVRRIEAYNTIAGNNADLGSWLDLAAALKDADVNDSVSKDDVYTAWANMGLSARETYAGITRSDFYNIVKSGAKSYAVNEDYAAQVDEGYASIVPAKEEADPTFSGSVRNHQADGSAAKSTSIFTMEDYYRALGLVK